MKIQTSQRMYSINDIVRLLKSGELVVQPKYQRRRTPWPANAKTALLDTILNNYPLPPIYLRDYKNKNGKRIKEIIDGQQRISTINEFMTNKFELTKVIGDKELTGLEFETLPNDYKNSLEDYEVAFITIKGADESDIVSIFSRLNSFSLPLNAQEKRNATYAGQLKTVVYRLATSYNTFWREFRILTDKSISRMGDALLVSELLYSINSGIKSITASDLNKFYKEFDKKFDDGEKVQDRFDSTMSIIGNLMENSTINKAFKSKYMFNSLFLAIYDRRFNFTQTIKTKKEINLGKSEAELEAFAKKYNEDKFDVEELYKLKQATGNTGHRQYRHRKILSFLQ